MPRVLIDTNIVSYLLKRDTRAASYAPHLSGHQIFVSFATIAELYRWAVTRKWGRRRINELKRHLQHYGVVTFDDRLAWEWAKVMSIPGRPITRAMHGSRLRHSGTNSH